MKLQVKTSSKSYAIILEKGCLDKLNTYISTERKCLIITDENIPDEYIEAIKKQCAFPYVYKTMAGEEAKSLTTYENILTYLVSHNFSRKDLIIALGGGVIGDLSGFIAATYVRGVEFVNIPTTTLSQIDSSIGGKVAVNLGKTKNMVGAFYPPSLVLIDPNTLKSLSKRHFNNGIVEALKVGMIKDEQLFDLIKDENIEENIETIIYKALLVKKEIVEEDEFEENVRKLLNFGHTLGHGFESYYNLSGLYHGEAVAIGMLKIIDNQKLKKLLIPILKKLELPLDLKYEKNDVFNYILRDKKTNNGTIDIIKLRRIGEAYIENVEIDTLRQYLED